MDSSGVQEPTAHAEQPPAADCLQRPLRSRFRQQLRRSVRATVTGLWSLFEGPLTTLVLGLALALPGVLLLKQYAPLLRERPRAVMSAEVLTALVTQAGGPGYLAAFLLASALVCGALSFVTLALNVASYVGGHASAP